MFAASLNVGTISDTVGTGAGGDESEAMVPPEGSETLTTAATTAQGEPELIMFYGEVNLRPRRHGGGPPGGRA
ncbi:hypothetical protein GCM10010387_19730 [Streptomyces inusitatus]|uniref:Uncharacterized protein n=1 Tax=Streptomyces inusitatus TaxID=68221 RepID=A0A918UQ48_9ACTN|nr:hypothetical protein GCM10010387_19730 [Streptomyces inusitatus]